MELMGEARTNHMNFRSSAGATDILERIKSVIRARRKVSQTQKLEEHQRVRNGYCICMGRVGNKGHLERIVRDMELEISYECHSNLFGMEPALPLFVWTQKCIFGSVNIFLSFHLACTYS